MIWYNNLYSTHLALATCELVMFSEQARRKALADQYAQMEEEEED